MPPKAIEISRISISGLLDACDEIVGFSIAAAILPTGRLTAFLTGLVAFDFFAIEACSYFTRRR
jgi:hypothetical protein